ncbi:MAG: AI-2E family transporter [Rikenellaceae bacterium]
MDSPKPYTLDRVVRLVISLIIFALIIYFLVITKDALIPFFVAWLIAYLINPIVLHAQRWLKIKSKLLAVVLVLVVGLGIITGLLWVLIPRFISEFEKIIVLLDQFIKTNNLTDIFPKQFGEQVAAYFQNSDFLKSLSAGDASELIRKAFSMTWSIVSESFILIFGLIAFFVTFIYLVFILKDYENITRGAVDLIPPKYKDRALVVIDDVEKGMDRYFRGQATVAMIVGVLLAIGFQIISLPMGFVLGLFIGVLNLVPYLQIVGIVPMIMLSILKSAETGENFWIIVGLAFMVLCIVQIIQDLFLVPKIMGKVTGLNPAIILLSLSIWGILLGIIGMIIALPLTTILLSYYKRFIINKESTEDFSKHE